MALKPYFSKKFKKDFHKKIRAGKDKDELLNIAQKLINREPLENKHKNHKLKGNYKGHWECHIEPDWLLIYKIEGEKILFERTGSHGELF
ncbi:MAG: type II toxin-antitoxin system YafQ family toxin [Candidatus Aminicenantes bacterium]|nr:type II toxin-antitoxin system YafQ family toxin [Candidatus Aminicenantes bacterium]